MFVEERCQEVLKILDRDNKVFVGDLARRFHVSIDTVRRDLAMMEEKGLLRRTHGGAIHATKVREWSGRAVAAEAEGGSAQHHAVARYAASLIEKGDTVFIGGSPLHFLMLEYLPADISYSVVTNSLATAGRLKECDNLDVFMVCGRIRPSGNTSDAFATEFIRSLRIDTAFLTGAGVSAKHGLSNASAQMAGLSRAVCEVSRRKIAMAVYDQIGKEGFARSVPLSELDMLITDWDSNEDELEKIRPLGVNVVVVEKPRV